MKSETLILIFTLTIFLVTGFATLSFSQESKQLFQQGLMAENGEGILQDAISIYEKVQVASSRLSGLIIEDSEDLSAIKT